MSEDLRRAAETLKQAIDQFVAAAERATPPAAESKASGGASLGERPPQAASSELRRIKPDRPVVRPDDVPYRSRRMSKIVREYSGGYTPTDIDAQEMAEDYYGVPDPRLFQDE